MNNISAKLVTAKESLNKQQRHMSDTAPVLRIKSAIQEIRISIHALELQSAILQHSLSQNWKNESHLTLL